MRPYTILIVLLSLIMCCESYATAPSQQPGAWEFHSRVLRIDADHTELPIREDHSIKCMTLQFVESGSYLNPTHREPMPPQCIVQGYARDENSAKWTITCSLPGGQTRNEFHVSAKEQSLRIEQFTEAIRTDGTRKKARVEVNAKRVEECTSELQELGVR